MEKITIGEILKATHGKLLSGDALCLFNTIDFITTNSQDIKSDALFIPLHGEKINAHDFIDDAFNNGAVATLTDEHDYCDSTKIYIKVENTLKALQNLAFYYKSKFNIPVIGITGSAGKTSTKEMISCALESKFNILKTQGNLNGQIGLPLTIFNLNTKHNMAIVEMGISKKNEMIALTNIAKPQFAVITNIGLTHIENLKTRENILQEKYHITDSFTNGSVLFINNDNEYLSKIQPNDKFKIVTFGINAKCDFKAENIKVIEDKTIFDVRINGKNEAITIPVIGTHNVYNALAAIAVGMSLDIPVNELKKQLLLYKTLDKRQCIYNKKFKVNDESLNITVIDDSYNANPDSTKSAIEVLHSIGEKSRKIAVLADMLELGEQSERLHFEVGKFVAQKKIDILICIGKQAEQIALGAKNEQYTKCYTFSTNESAFEKLKEILKDKDIILVKGSRGMQTDEIVKKILDE